MSFSKAMNEKMAKNDMSVAVLSSVTKIPVHFLQEYLAGEGLTVMPVWHLSLLSTALEWSADMMCLLIFKKENENGEEKKGS